MSERVMIWSSTRAIISSTMLSAWTATAINRRADASRYNFLSMFEKPLSGATDMRLFYQRTDQCSHPIECGQPLLLRFFLVEQAAQHTLYIRFLLALRAILALHCLHQAVLQRALGDARHGGAEFRA